MNNMCWGCLIVWLIIGCTLLYPYIWSVSTLCNSRGLLMFSLIVSSLSYASPPIWKLHLHGDIISQLYKPTFHGSHLSCNMPYGSAATIWIFYLPWWKFPSIWLGLPWRGYFCQYLNTETSTWGNRGYPTKTLSIFYSRNSYIRLVVTL